MTRRRSHRWQDVAVTVVFLAVLLLFAFGVEVPQP